MIDIDISLLNSTFRLIAPILLAALGGLLCDRVLIFNMALEGNMLLGAFTAVAVSYYTGSSFAGVLVAAIIGALFSLLLGLFVVRFKGDAIVSGISLNLFATGLTTFLLRRIFGVKGFFKDPAIIGLDNLEIPLIRDIPFIGGIISGHSWVVYASWVLVVVISIVLFKQVIGLRMRGVGQNDKAAVTLGVNVNGIRYAALAFSGILCGIGGAQLSLGQVTLFSENMSAGRGWIAVVAVMLGRAHPIGVFVASILFGFTDAVGFRLQGMGLPYQLTAMLPYVVTLIAMFFVQFVNKKRNLLNQ